MLRPAAAVAVALALAVSPLPAQDLVALCKQMSHPAVGSWSSYQIKGGSNDGATIKISVVGTESHGDTAYLWVEMAMTGFEAGPGQKFSGLSKMLVPGFGPGMQNPRAMILKIGTAPAMTMPMSGPMGRMAGGDRTGFSKCGEGKSLGYADVIVPAGTFHALHVQDQDGSEIWVMPTMALGLIKVTKVNAGGGDLVMTGHGTGAKDALTEAPVPFNPAIMMQMMGGQNSH
ncbi:MAG TPA: hypothetical protein VJN62_12840 [Gemmatimonadales bacterium]|nr:hypothetical protein [Gemmatimonadales bacterium]